MTKIKTITLIGANGQMGAMLAKTFGKSGYSVTMLDLPYDDESSQKALTGCDLLMLCIPVTAVKTTLEYFTKFISPTTILCDICSVKVLPVKTMQQYHDGPIVGTHPLFGPVIPNGFEPRVVITPARPSDAQAGERVCQLLTNCNFETFYSTPEEHDRSMAYIQGLNFTSTVAFLAAARNEPSIQKFITPSFQRRLDAAHKMLTEDADLFEIISEANPFVQETNRKFMAYLGLAAGGDLDLLANHAQWWWKTKTTKDEQSKSAFCTKKS